MKRFSPLSHALDEQTACPVNAETALLYVTPSVAARVAVSWSSASESWFAFVSSVALIPSEPKQLARHQ